MTARKPGVGGHRTTKNAEKTLARAASAGAAHRDVRTSFGGVELCA
jgi:hypothetical protein